MNKKQFITNVEITIDPLTGDGVIQTESKGIDLEYFLFLTFIVLFMFALFFSKVLGMIP